MKRYYLEEGSDEVQRLFSSQDARMCSVLGLIEVMSTQARKLWASEMIREDFDRKLVEIDHDWQHFLQIELTQGELHKARHAAVRFSLRGADAVHFAAFQSIHQRLSGRGHQVLLVASDRELEQAAEAAGLPVLVPGAPSRI